MDSKKKSGDGFTDTITQRYSDVKRCLIIHSLSYAHKEDSYVYKYPPFYTRQAIIFMSIYIVNINSTTFWWNNMSGDAAQCHMDVK